MSASRQRATRKSAPNPRRRAGAPPAPRRPATPRRPAPPAEQRSPQRSPQRSRRAPGGGESLPRQAAPGLVARWNLLAAIFLLLLYGLVMSYSASSGKAYFEYKSSVHFLERQFAFALVGLIAMFLISKIDYGTWRRFAKPAFAIALLGLVLVLIPGVGVVVNGARRWISLGGQALQPSEIAKLAAVILVAMLVARRPQIVTTARGYLFLVGVGILPSALLIMREPDLGTTLVLSCGVISILVMAGGRMRHILATVGVGVVMILAAIIVEPYRLQRLMTFLDPWKDPHGSGHQATQSLISIASGGLFGVGLGNSVQKFGFLPEQSTDMITGIIGEELGLLGLLVLILLYLFLLWTGFRIAIECKEIFGKLLAGGITSLVAAQVCINMGAALGLLPLTGVPLPLVSIGGTNLVVILSALGILLNITTNRRSSLVVTDQRSHRAPRGGGDRRPPAAGPRRRG